jgi:predicted RecB family endonuclease
VEPEICNHFQRRGFNVSSSYTNRKVKVNGEFIAEIDLTVENGDTTVLVEVKTTLKEAHVDEHIARLTAVQQANVPPYAGKKLVGAIAAINVPESVERYAIKAGFFVLYPVEEIVGVVNSDDFQPRVWEPIA